MMFMSSTVTLKKETIERLKRLGKFGESWDELMDRILVELENKKESGELSEVVEVKPTEDGYTITIKSPETGHKATFEVSKEDYKGLGSPTKGSKLMYNLDAKK